MLGSHFTASTFFEEQLTAFESWLEFGSENKPAPMQLPVVLQVLLSQGHRLRALVLLARFLDKGSWAVNLVSLAHCYSFNMDSLLWCRVSLLVCFHTYCAYYRVLAPVR